MGKDTLLRGEYRLLEAIGGRESRVYRARRVTTDDGNAAALSVARLWRPDAALLREHGAQALFERAAAQLRSATLLRHPVLALVETSGALEDGTLFMVSEHVEGQPLDAWMDSAGIPPLPSVIDLAYRVCSGLNAAHRNGLAHAALHPRSVLVRPYGEAGAITRVHGKLIDLGAPTCMFSSPPSLHAARFMAPEQLEHALRSTIERAEPTVRMNVYGCGALLYYLCTGGPPLPGRSIDELLVAHAAHKVLPPSRINPQVIPALDAIILKALEPQPRARFASAAELANALISIRFERSASGVRPRAPSEPTAAPGPSARLDATPRDRRVTLDLNEREPLELAAELEERPTSKTQRPPASDEAQRAAPALSFEPPTAVVPPLPEWPPLTPLPPSMPPPSVERAEAPAAVRAEEEEPAAELGRDAPDPQPAALERAEPPAVLARAARRSFVPASTLLERVPPSVLIALTAVLSLAVIYAVIARPEPAASIEVTPLPQTASPPRPSPPAAPDPSPRANAAAPDPSTSVDDDEAASVERALRASEPRAGEPRDKRARKSTRASEPERRALPVPNELDEPREPSALDAHASVVEDGAQGGRAIAPPPPAPIEPATPAAREPTAPEPERAPATAQVPQAPRPSAIAPLPDRPASPIAPLAEDAAPRWYGVEVKGSLATSQVRRGVERIEGAVRDCYRAALAARPAALGEVQMEVEIDERGRARDARASGAVPSSLRRCLERAASRISVPPPDTGTVTATWKVAL